MAKKKMVVLTTEQKAPGHFEGKFWIWADGKKTHVRFIHMAMRTMKKVPPGFLKACEESEDPGLIKMGVIAKKRKLKELS